MRIVDAFLGEHGVLYAQFDHIEQELSAETPPDVIHAIAAILMAALLSHARMEDELLFGPAMEETPWQGPLAAMLEDHEMIEHTLEVAQRTADPVRARTLLLEGVRAAREHFEREERVAFQLAETALGEDRLTELGELWAAVRGVALEPAS